MILVRILTGLVVLAIVAVAAVPMLALIDLVGGGDGWGLCPTGLGSCSMSYFDGPELMAMITIVLFALVGILRLLFRVQRAVERHRARVLARAQRRISSMTH